ncbi:MAG: hypothetical protein P8L66_01735 [Rhodospirillaceae bacterium]|nr:hypothetical protein [Rhodospirillaceae bacterium]
MTGTLVIARGNATGKAHVHAWRSVFAAQERLGASPYDELRLTARALWSAYPLR